MQKVLCKDCKAWKPVKDDPQKRGVCGKARKKNPGDADALTMPTDGCRLGEAK